MRFTASLMAAAVACTMAGAAQAQLVNPARDGGAGHLASADDTSVPGAVGSAAVSSGGAGFSVGATVTIAGGTCAVAPVLTVTSVSGGAITAVAITTAGRCVAPPANPASGTGTGGTVAAFALAWLPQAVTLFGGAVPDNGWKIANPDASADLWANDNGAAAVRTGVRIFADGGQYATEPGEKPVGPVSVTGTVIGQKISARRW